MAKRSRTDGTQGQSEIMAGVFTETKPPKDVKFNALQKRIWIDLVRSKASRSWTVSDLYMLADLVFIHAQVIQYRKLIGSELASLEDHKTLDLLVKRARLLNAHLQIHAEATQGKSREQVSQNQAHQDAQQTASQYEGDELLARPH